MKKYFKILSILVVVVIALTFTGCGKGKSNKNSIVGKWQSKDYSSYVYTFNEDGTGDYSGAKFTYTTDGNKISIKYETSTAAFESTYEIKDNELNIKDSLGKDTIYTRKYAIIYIC